MEKNNYKGIHQKCSKIAYPGLILKMYEHRVVQQTYLGKVKKVGIWNVIERKDIFHFNSLRSNDLPTALLVLKG